MIINGEDVPITTDEWIRERMADDYGAESQNWRPELPDMETTAKAIRTAARTAENIIKEAVANAEIGR